MINVFGNTSWISWHPSFNCKANVTITGVSATGELGTPFKWQEIDDSQTPNWTEVAA